MAAVVGVALLEAPPLLGVLHMPTVQVMPSRQARRVLEKVGEVLVGLGVMV